MAQAKVPDATAGGPPDRVQKGPDDDVEAPGRGWACPGTTAVGRGGVSHRGGPAVIFRNSPQLLKEEPMAPASMDVVIWLRNRLEETKRRRAP